jgi:hypothetical protein
MAAVNPLQRLTQDPKACFAEDDEAGVRMQQVISSSEFCLSYLVLNRTFRPAISLQRTVVVTCTTSVNNKHLCNFV